MILKSHISVLLCITGLSLMLVTIPAAKDSAAVIDSSEQSSVAAKNEECILDKIEFHASFSQGYLNSSKNNWIGNTQGGTFDFNEFAVNLSYEVTSKLRAGFQVMSRDFGPLMDNEVYLDWLTIDYGWQDELGIVVGRLKSPFGLYNASRDVDSARISILLPTGVYRERARDQTEYIDGGALYGTVPVASAGSLDYYVSYGRKIFSNKGGSVHFLEEDNNILDEGSTTNFEAKDIITMRISYDTPLEGLRVVAGYAQSTFSLDGRSSIGGVPGGPASISISKGYSWVGSVEYTINDFIFAAEYRHLENPDQTFTFQHILHGSTTISFDIPSVGWYVSGSYRFTDWLAAELYYSEIYPDDSDRDGSRFTAKGQDDFLAWQKDICLTTRFDVTENWILKTGVTLSNGLGGGFVTDYPVAGTASEDWIMYQLKATFVF